MSEKKLTPTQRLEAQNEALALKCAELQTALDAAKLRADKLHAECLTRGHRYNELLAAYRTLESQPAAPAAKRASLTGHKDYATYCNAERAVQRAHGAKTITFASREQWEAANRETVAESN